MNSTLGSRFREPVYSYPSGETVHGRHTAASHSYRYSFWNQLFTTIVFQGLTVHGFPLSRASYPRTLLQTPCHPSTRHSARATKHESDLRGRYYQTPVIYTSFFQHSVIHEKLLHKHDNFAQSLPETCHSGCHLQKLAVVGVTCKYLQRMGYFLESTICGEPLLRTCRQWQQLPGHYHPWESFQKSENSVGGTSVHLGFKLLYSTCKEATLCTGHFPDLPSTESTSRNLPSECVVTTFHLWSCLKNLSSMKAISKNQLST